MSTPIRSMTGFAQARRPLATGELAVSVKSVNHRGLDIQVRGPEVLDPFEVAMRALVKSHVARGHVEIRVTIPGASGGGSELALNRRKLEQYVSAFREAAAAHSIETAPDLNLAFRIPGIFGPPEGAELPDGTEAVLLDALADALHHLNSFREREGTEIAAEMQKHSAAVAAAAEQMEDIRAGAVSLFQNRLTEKLKELLKSAQLDPQRVVQEAAILADRSDIGEELARLKIHARQLSGLLDGGGEVGKKLDFLLQEMNRETNTILSKTGGAADAGLRITELALGAKAAIEKIREQALNLE